ncbi:MAG: hypothetical protein L0331_09090 [Chloroflexi bacterium]|nr:hypothetical protein [Chloroflexota bacterium]
MIIKPSLAQASDTDLADAVQENLFALFRAMMVLPGGEIVEGEKVCYHHAFPSNPMFKGVWRTCLSPEEADEAIDQTLAWFQARQAPYVFWWVGPQTTPADLPERLQARGFTANMVGDPGMAADLRTLDETVRTPDGFTIVKAADKATLEAWRDVFCAAYDIPPFVGQAWVEATLTTGPASAPGNYTSATGTKSPSPATSCSTAPAWPASTASAQSPKRAAGALAPPSLCGLSWTPATRATATACSSRPKWATPSINVSVSRKYPARSAATYCGIRE